MIKAQTFDLYAIGREHPVKGSQIRGTRYMLQTEETARSLADNTNLFAKHKLWAPIKVTITVLDVLEYAFKPPEKYIGDNVAADGLDDEA